MNRVAGGIITLNGMPTLPYVIAAMAEVVDHIYIVEGAVPASKVEPDGDGFCSTDGTADYLKHFFGQRNITVIPSGVMDTKTDMWNVWMPLVAGRYNYLLVLDDDEIPSSPDAVNQAIEYMDKNPEVACLAFRPINFFGDLDTVATGGMFSQPHRRLWSLVKGASFTAHRPPQIHSFEKVEAFPMSLYHYSWIGRERARKKCEFYERLLPLHPRYGRQMEWYHGAYLKALDGKPIDEGFGYHPSDSGLGRSRLAPFDGCHPEVIREDILSGEVRFD